MQFAFMLNEFDYTEFLNLDKIHDCITIDFAENGCFINKKGMEKLI